MLWLTERVTRFSIGVTMPEDYAGESMVAGLCCGLDQIPAHLLRSITFDQGSEWACWETVAATREGQTSASRKDELAAAARRTAIVRRPTCR